MAIRLPYAKPGSRITLEVLEDLQLAVSACPQDLIDCNGTRLTDLMLEVSDS